ncbi:glycoside hydrolase family 2 TIM barrel-domain containing protein, partial [Flavicella sp.]|uniref:glycoside hydrolase family 2 TIM barrel-domain containing protein n=1 Tax=Flavicella sp. TaxID=2957742 RepID=UPI002623C958
ANFMRIMHGTQNKKLIELCDRKGILIFEEVNVRDLDNEEFTAPEFPLIKKWLKGMIERDINHPSIIGWSVGNELNNHFEFARSTMEYVKTKLDPYRLLTCVSNSGQKPDYTPETDPNTFVDIIMHNMYRWQGEPQEILNTLRKKWPNKPIFISEFGFDPFASPSLDIDKPVLSEWIQHFRNKNEFVVGTSMWTFNDYRSGYGGTSAEENRVWGIINVWRQKRKYFERVKKEQSPVKDIEITNIDFEKNTANIEIPIRDSHDYPSYAMRNYKLEYQFKNTKGKTVYQNSVNLPDLLPKNKIWNGTLKWDTLPEDILALNIKLISPTNYSRFDKTVSFKKAIQPGIKQIIPGKNSVRILFETVQNANEYFVRYKNAAGKFTESYRTITNSIDITNLEEGKEYTFQLFAVNDKGISKGSRGKNASPNKKILPPTIWKSFIADNKLVIGYSSEFEDIKYNVRYGTSNDNLNQKFISNVRGMMSIDLNGENEIYFQIKRKSKLGISSWSQIIKTKH